MAFLGKKKNTGDSKSASGQDKKEVAEVAPTPVKKVVPKEGVKDTSIDSNLVYRPRVTEKASFVSAIDNAYAFDVSPRATKKTVAKIIESTYGVTPRKVTILPVPSKKTFVKGKRGVKSGGKKAYVFLKDGDKIEVI